MSQLNKTPLLCKGVLFNTMAFANRLRRTVKTHYLHCFARIALMTIRFRAFREISQNSAGLILYSKAADLLKIYFVTISYIRIRPHRNAFFACPSFALKRFWMVSCRPYLFCLKISTAPSSRGYRCE